MKIFGTHDENTLEQMKVVNATAERTALMADGHLGYSMPIGGVAAFDNAVSVTGVGFDIAKVEANYATARLKLEERAASVNGRIEIESAPGKGTKVTMTIPVDVKPTAVGD